MVDSEKGITHTKKSRGFTVVVWRGVERDIFWRAVLQDVNETGST